MRILQNVIYKSSIQQRVMLIIIFVAATTAVLLWNASRRSLERSINSSIEFAAQEVSTALIAHIGALRGPLMPEIRAITRSTVGIAALKEGDNHALAIEMQPTINRLKARGVSNYVAVFDSEGHTRYLDGVESSSQETMRQLVSLVLETKKPQSGFDLINQKSAYFGYAMPLLSERVVVGVAVLAVDLREAFSEIAYQSGHISAFRVISMIKGDTKNPWEPSYTRLQTEQSDNIAYQAPDISSIDVAFEQGTHGVDIDFKGKTWRGLKVEFNDVHGGLLAEGVIFSDVTADSHAAAKDQYVANMLIIAAISLVILACSYWLNHAFRPLNQAIHKMIRIVDEKQSREIGGHRGGEKWLNEVDRITLVVEKVVKVFEDRRQLQKSAEYDATHDALTGISNRAFFLRELGSVLVGRRTSPNRGGGALFMIDLDHFKILNDTRGHHAGDLLLKELGKRMMQFSHEGNVVARLGGDEFAILMPSRAHTSDFDKMVSKLHKKLCSPTELDGEPYVPSFSVGVTRFPEDGTTSKGLLVNADMALYEAKRNGRNQWKLFVPSMRERMDDRENIRRAILYALENNSIEIALQPIFCTRTNEQRGFEVLCRLWFDGERISPDHFIPVAEEYGLIGAVGLTVLRKAAASQRKMLNLGLEPGQLALNVAPHQLRDSDFFETVQDILFENELRPESICFEITETALIGRSVEAVRMTLTKLKKIGVQIALDDFGTGYSSLSHLREFSVDKLKIDKSFVQGMKRDQSDRALVDGIIRLADKLDMKVVAEGVETQEQLDYLLRIGCHYSQGFLHSKPLPIELAIEYLEKQPNRGSLGSGLIANK